jgi:hypothetical protein
LEDGLAAALGGTGYWSAGVTLQHGAARLQHGATQPVDAELRAGAVDATAAGAVWADALLAKLGAARSLELVRSLSGGATQVRARDAAAVRQAIEAALGRGGSALEDLVREHATRLAPPITAGCITIPVETQTQRPQIRWRDGSENWAFDFFDAGDEFVALLAPYQGPIPAWAQKMMDSLQTAQTGVKKPASESAKPKPRPAGDPPQLSLLFRERMVTEPDAFESPLFASHFASRRYAGELAGIFIRPDGLEMWDYRRGILIGKIAPELALPADAPYYDRAAGRICFRIRRDLIPQPLLDHFAVCALYTGE